LVELIDEGADVGDDVLAGGADVICRAVLGVGALPVDVALAGM